MNTSNEISVIEGNKKKWLLLAFIFSFLLAACILLPNMIKNGGILYLSSDYMSQQIPFNITYNDDLKENGLNYTFKNDLGDNFVSSYSFYDVFSPFNLFNYIFPSDWIPYSLGYIYMLKFAFAALSAFIFLDNIVKNPKLSFLGSILYAFSGFQIVNLIFYHFHDVVVFFPLLLYSLDKLMIENKKGRFAIILGICVITNYIFAFGEMIFLCIYFLINVFFLRYCFTKGNILHGLIESIIALGISAFVLIPSAIEILQNPDANTHIDIKNLLFMPIAEYIKLFQAFILPADNFFKSTFALTNNVLSREICLPFVSVILVIAWIIAKPKDKWNIIIYIYVYYLC